MINLAEILGNAGNRCTFIATALARILPFLGYGRKALIFLRHSGHTPHTNARTNIKDFIDNWHALSLPPL